MSAHHTVPVELTQKTVARRNDPFIQAHSLLKIGAEYVAIINKNGKITDSVFKNDMDLATQRREMFCMSLRLQGSMQEDFDSEFGPVIYTITERERTKFIIFPLIEETLLVKLDRSADPFLIINKILMEIPHKLKESHIGVC